MICTFVLSIGLLGLAALIPVGRLAINQTAIADRSGACGRAALREMKIRRMLEPGRWLHFDGAAAGNDALLQAAFVIDPLFIAEYNEATATLPTPVPPPDFGNSRASAVFINRFTLDCPGISPSQPMSYALAERIFRWRDDLDFDYDDPDQRPVGTNPDGSPGYKGDYTWLITVSPAPAEATLNPSQKTQYLVSAVVCFKRDIQVNIDLSPPGAVSEHTAIATFLGGVGYGGGSVQILPSDWTPGPPEKIRDNQWIMLCNGMHALWYRVVSVSEGSAATVPPTPTRLTLAGPDWDTVAWCTADLDGDPSTFDVQAIFIDGVVGVYTTTIER